MITNKLSTSNEYSYVYYGPNTAYWTICCLIAKHFMVSIPSTLFGTIYWNEYKDTQAVKIRSRSPPEINDLISVPNP